MVKSLPLTNGGTVLVDDEDYPLVSQVNWCRNKRDRIIASVPKHLRSLFGARYPEMGRLLTEAPRGMVVDHINGDRADNRRCNLRVCTQAQNLQNRRGNIDSSSRYKGVTWNKRVGKWQASLKYKGKYHHLGLYVSEQAAARVYDAKARELFGEYAWLNFPKRKRGHSAATQCARLFGRTDAVCSKCLCYRICMDSKTTEGDRRDQEAIMTTIMTLGGTKGHYG